MVCPMYRVLHVHPSGYYKWLANPESLRTQENQALTALIIEYWEGSDKTYEALASIGILGNQASDVEKIA